MLLVVHFDGGAIGLVTGSFTGTLVALLVVLWDRRAVLFGHDRPRARCGRSCTSACRSCPRAWRIWALNLSNRILVAWLGHGAIAGVFVVGANLAQAVALLVMAFQLAWPPFAYGIKDDDEARLVYRSVLTLWLLVALAVVLPLALDRDWILALLAGESYLGAADAMALTALGLAFYGAYYVVGVAVGPRQEDAAQLDRHGHRRDRERRALIVLVPDYGATGAGAASAIAYFLMAILMIARGNRVFPVGYDWWRLAGLCALAGALFALGERALPARMAAGGVAGRFVVAGLFVPLALSGDRAMRRAALRR